MSLRFGILVVGIASDHCVQANAIVANDANKQAYQQCGPHDPAANCTFVPGAILPRYEQIPTGARKVPKVLRESFYWT